MTLLLIVSVMLALLAGIALVALAPPLERHTHVLPAVRTVALLSAAVIYIAALWSHT